MSVLICPNCGASFREDAHGARCENGHCFDRAKEGYLNLTIGSRSGEGRGDSRASARARHEFLSKGYYSCLRDAVSSKLQGTVLDICCGEGYYDTYDGPFYGFDLSKEMVRLAARRHRAENYHYFVANLAHIPVADGSIDTAIHLFAPFHDAEFSRVLKPDGRLYSVIPGADHLIEMKEQVYETPYRNDEAAPETQRLRLLGRETVKQQVRIGREDLKELFSMTPYYYRTSVENRAKLDRVEQMDLTVHFVILQYGK